MTCHPYWFIILNVILNLRIILILVCQWSSSMLFILNSSISVFILSLLIVSPLNPSLNAIKQPYSSILRISLNKSLELLLLLAQLMVLLFVLMWDYLYKIPSLRWCMQQLIQQIQQIHVLIWTIIYQIKFILKHILSYLIQTNDMLISNQITKINLLSYQGIVLFFTQFTSCIIGLLLKYVNSLILITTNKSDIGGTSYDNYLHSF